MEKSHRGCAQKRRGEDSDGDFSNGTVYNALISHTYLCSIPGLSKVVLILESMIDILVGMSMRGGSGMR